MNIRALKDRMFDLLSRHSVGFTLDPSTVPVQAAPASGFYVGVAGAELRVDLRHFKVPPEPLVYAWCLMFERLANTTRDKLYAGAWVAGDELYLDASVRRDTLEDALRVARENKQLSIFDVNTQKIVWVDRD